MTVVGEAHANYAEDMRAAARLIERALNSAVSNEEAMQDKTLVVILRGKSAKHMEYVKLEQANDIRS